MRPGRAVEVVAAQIARVQPRGPYLLCGAGSGAWLAAELASSLERRGRVVALIGRLAPSPARLSIARTRRPGELLRGLATSALLACRARPVCSARAIDVEGPIDLATALARLDASRSASGP